eukprot:1160965-Pelagomonas_calceolata.AAC.5
MPKPVWTYPLHYISFHSYTFYGFMQNEFENTDARVLKVPVAKCFCMLVDEGAKLQLHADKGYMQANKGAELGLQAWAACRLTKMLSLG